ncbi:neurotrimin-like isoform X2 [Macrobrachium rosenbergii]|uniref:neurotrimin-like isoform X2 n=1 Tax=Macrobrachium rosenbergii TaxID=79674 RepID=UPI0034D624BF
MATEAAIPAKRLAFAALFAIVAVGIVPFGTCTSPRPPKFVATIPNVTVTAGRDASLPCVVENIGDYKVSWMHLDRVMLLTIDENVITLIPRYRVTKDDSTTWTLHIENVSPDDTGYYVCQVNMEPVINQVGYVQVVVPPKFVDEESSQSHVSVQEENDVRLMCRAEGVPKPKIHWKREDEKPFSIKGPQNNVKQIESEELLLKKVTRKDMGAYLCIASNKVPPSISKRIVLDIQFQPVITVPNQLVGAPIGTSVTLECQVAAFPNAVHFWSFSDQLLINSTRQETQEIRDGYTTVMKLSLRNLRPEDFGTYVCTAKNSLGEAASNVRLYEILMKIKPDEDHNKEKNHIEPILRPEHRSDERLVDPWLRPDVDSDIPGYPLEENNFIHGGSGGPPNPFSGRPSGASRSPGGGSTSSGRSNGLAAGSGGGGGGDPCRSALGWKVLWASSFAYLLSPVPSDSRKVLWLWAVLGIVVVVFCHACPLASGARRDALGSYAAADTPRPHAHLGAHT